MIARLYSALIHHIARRAPLLVEHFPTALLLDELAQREVITANQRRAFASGDYSQIAAGLPLSEMVKALRDQDALNAEEADCLLDGDVLSELYGCDCESQRTPPTYDARAYEQASAAIRYGDLAEALVQVGRLLPGLDRLPDLYARRKGA